MSLLQIYVNETSASIAVDTNAHGMLANQSGGLREVSKLMPIPHAGVVLAYRGSDVAFFNLFAQFMLGQDWSDFDSGKDVLPLKCSHAMTQFPEALPHELGRAQIVIAGYSKRLRRMAASMFRIDIAAGATELDRDVTNGACAPYGSEVFEGSDAGMLAFAATQVAWMKANEPGQATGGRLLCAELKPGSITIRDVGPIPE